MTISTGQFGGVFWHDSEGNEQEVVDPNNKKPVQGMLFHPLTGTGVPGDPLQTTVGRERDVRDAFGFSFPDIEKSGIPRNLLGTQGDNPTLTRLDGRKKQSAGSYNPVDNTIALRPAEHVLADGETPVHEMGHARDRARLMDIGSTTGFIPELEGTADAYQDRFSSNNIMRSEGSFDPLINPNRTSEIMKEPIEVLGNQRWALRGYGGNSIAWRDKVEQATYAIGRMLGALNPTGLPNRRPKVKRGNSFSAAGHLSNQLLTKAQRTQSDIGSPTGTGNWWHYVSRGDTTTARTIDIGRMYKHNPRVKTLLDEAGLGDLGEFATHVHTAHMESRRNMKYNQREKARDVGRLYDAGSEHHADDAQRYFSGTLSSGEPMSRNQRLAFLQPSLFDDNPEAMKIIDPPPAGTVDFRNDSEAKDWMKRNKIKKPSKREESEWGKLKKEVNG